MDIRPVALNVGSGTHPLPGWVNVDPAPDISTTIDIVGRLPTLPFAAGTFDRAYAGHVLEHLRWGDELTAGIQEIARVVRPGGTLMIVGPCIAKAAEQQNWLIVRAIIGDFPGRPLGTVLDGPGCHQWIPTEALTVRAVQAAGLVADLVDVATVRQPEWPNVEPGGAWQTAMRCTVA